MHTTRVLALCAACLVAGPGAFARPDPAADVDPALEARLVPPAGAQATRLELSGGPAFGRGLLLLGADSRGGRFPGGLAVRPLHLQPVVLDGDGVFSHALGRGDWTGLRAQFWIGTPLGRKGAYSNPVGPRLAATMAPPHQRGTLVITEFMKDPAVVSDSNGEWVEIHNPTQGRFNLEGMTLSDAGSNLHVIDTGGLGLFLRPGATIVLGNNADRTTNGGIPVRYQYSGFTLTNSDDEIILSAANGVVMDSVAYDDGVLWPDQSGMSISLSPAATDALSNDDPANWCHATSPASPGSSDTGTPKLPNDTCP